MSSTSSESQGSPVVSRPPDPSPAPKQPVQPVQPVPAGPNPFPALSVESLSCDVTCVPEALRHKAMWQLVCELLALEDVMVMERACRTMYAWLRDERWWRARCFALARVSDFVVQLDEHLTYRQQFVHFKSFRPNLNNTHVLQLAFLGPATVAERERLVEWMAPRNAQTAPGLVSYCSGAHPTSSTRVVALRKKAFNLRFCVVEGVTDVSPWQVIVHCYSSADQASRVNSELRATLSRIDKCAVEVLMVLATVALGPRTLLDGIAPQNNPSIVGLAAKLAEKHAILRTMEAERLPSPPGPIVVGIPALSCADADDSRVVLRTLLEQFLLLRIDLTQAIGQSLSLAGTIRAQHPGRYPEPVPAPVPARKKVAGREEEEEKHNKCVVH